jgi:hypothetical protein
MDSFKNSVKFDSLLKEYKTLEENIFISRISDIAEENIDLVINKIQDTLIKPEISIHLKYLLIKVIENLKNHKFLPLLASLLENEDRERIVWEILNAFASITTVESYKIIVGFFSKSENRNFIHKFKTYLKIYFKKKPLIYHYDIFYRNRGDIKNIESSGKFLIENLNETYVKDILPAIYSKYENISEEALKIIERRKGPLYFHSVDKLFIAKYKSSKMKYFKQMTRTLFENALVSPHKKKIVSKLYNYLNLLPEDKQNYYIIYLLKIDTARIIERAIDIYDELSVDDSLLFLNNLEKEVYSIYKFFIRGLLKEEVNENILLKIIKILIENEEFDFLFDSIEKQNGTRRELLINMIVETGYEGMSNYLIKFISLSEDNAIIFSAVGYLMNDNPDNFFDELKNLIFSGVDIRIKQKIIRNVKKFNDENIYEFMNLILENTIALKGLEKDFLLLAVALQEKVMFDGPFLEELLNRVLMMMEETEPKGIINYIYFFDSFKIKNRKQLELIINELKMVQKTLLKSTEYDDTVSMIYRLIKKLDA